MQYVRFKDYIKPAAPSVIFGVIVALFLWYDLYIPVGFAECNGENLCLGDSPIIAFLWDSVYIHSWRGMLISFLLLIGICFLMIRLNEVFSFINIRTVLPAYVFGVVYSVFYFPHGFSMSLVVALFILGAIYYSFMMANLPYEEMSKCAFNIGLLLAGATLISVPCFFYVLPLLAFFYVFKALTLRNVLALFFGFLLPILYLMIYLVYTNSIDSLILFVESSLTFGVFSSYGSLEWWDWGYLIFFSFLFLLGILKYPQWRNQLNVKNREEHFFILVYLLFTLILVLVMAIDVELLFPLIFLFASFTIGQYFSMQFTLFSKIVGVLFLLATLSLFCHRTINSLC